MNYARHTNPPRHRGGFHHVRGHAIKLIVAGGILGMAIGASVGATLGYRAGAYTAWRLITQRLRHQAAHHGEA